MFVRRRRPAAWAVVSAALAVAWSASPACAQIRAFGQAEGFGASVTGGRGGSVFHVKNLDDSGPYSFRDAVSASNRIIVFDVGGIINLQSDISAKSNLTIAGQTAPGGGISLNGYELSFANQSNIDCRYLHLRPGDGSPSTDDCLSLYNATNVIMDHVSMEFAKWNNIDAVTDNGAAPNVTIQNSIIANPIGQQFGAHLESIYGGFTLTKNLFANSHNRNPLAKVNDQSINNVNYNYEAAYTTHTGTPFKHDLVNNAFIYGPATGGNTYYQLSSGDTFYATGNVRDTDMDGALDTGGILNPTTGTIVSTPNFASTPSLPTLSVADAYSYVVAHAGASLSRDDLDSLVISQVQTLGNAPAGKTAGTAGPSGGLYGSAGSDGLANTGLGVTAAGTRPAGFDSDGDGIPDTWETAEGLNPSDGTDAVKLNPLGYLMVEQYLNELADVNTLRTYSAASGSLTTAASWGGTLPTAMDNAAIVGTGAANGAATFTSGTMSVMKLDVGGNGPAAGETLSVSGGKLVVYDTMTVGANNNATVNISGSATLQAYNIILGNTLFSPSVINYTGTINLSGGTLAVSSLVNGAGAPGAWTGGGQLNFSGGTLAALGTMNVNVPMVVTGSGGTIDTNGFDGVFSGIISGSGGLTKNGAGTLTLTGANTMQGGIKVNAGTLSLNNITAAGTGSVTLNGGNVTLGSVSGITTPFVLSKSGSITAGGITSNGAITGSASVTLSVNTSSTGNFTIAGDLSNFLGTIDFSGSTGNIRLNNLAANGSALANFNLGSSTAALRTAGAATVNLGSLAGGASTKLQGATNSTSAVTCVVGANNASTTFAGTITDGTFAPPGAVSLTKTGTGTLTVSGTANTYTGVTTIKGGTLSVSTLAIGGTASGIGQSTNAAANLVFDGGTLQYTGSAIATDHGFTVTQNGGTIQRDGTGNVDFNNTSNVTMFGTGDRTLTLTGTSTSFNNLYAGITDPASGKTSLTKDGVGTWRLFGNAKTYSGNTQIKAGTLYLPVANILPFGAGKGNVNISAGATLEMYGNNQSINGLLGAGTVTTSLNTARTLTVGNGDASGDFSGVLTQGASQTLSLSKVGAGTQILRGANLYTGNTTVTGGMLELGPTGSLSSGNNLTINATSNPAAAKFDARSITGIQPITLGNLNLIVGGSITVVSNTNASPATAPGSTANHGNRIVLTTNSLTNTGNIDLGGNDLIIHNGSLATINSQVALGFNGPGYWNGTANGSIRSSAAANDTTFLTTLATAQAAASGTLGGDTVATNDVLVKYTYYGDADLSGTVDGNDYSIIDANIGPAGQGIKLWSQGDFNYDGLVNGSDYTLIDNVLDRQGAAGLASPMNRFAKATSEIADGSGTAVPEPAPLSLLGIVAIGLLPRRRR